MLFFNANFICYYFYPTKKREEPFSDSITKLTFLELRMIQGKGHAKRRCC